MKDRDTALDKYHNKLAGIKVTLDKVENMRGVTDELVQLVRLELDTLNVIVSSLIR